MEELGATFDPNDNERATSVLEDPQFLEYVQSGESKLSWKNPDQRGNSTDALVLAFSGGNMAVFTRNKEDAVWNNGVMVLENEWVVRTHVKDDGPYYKKWNLGNFVGPLRVRLF